MTSASLDDTIQALVNGSEIPVAKIPVDMKQSLLDMGLSLKLANNAYLLDNPPELLKKELIFDEIGETNRSLMGDLEIHTSLGSTNDYLLSKMNQQAGHGTVCLAEHQSAGKGRRGRTWVSPFGSNLYMSIAWSLPKDTKGLSSLSLVVGMEIVLTLESLGLLDVKLKWPNDLLREGSKLGGILIEMVHLDAAHGMVIGIGINFESGIPQLSEVEQSVGYVPSSCGVGRNLLVGRILERLLPALHSFNSKGFGSYHPQWQDLNLYQNKLVNIIRGKEVFKGVDRGIDVDGNLLLQRGGEILKFSSGEVSLRPADSSSSYSGLSDSEPHDSGLGDSDWQKDESR